MKLNKNQRYALAMWLGRNVPKIELDHAVVSNMDEFCDGKFQEWQIIYVFGFAGKIWNVLDKLYITGYPPIGIDKKSYKKQQKIIEEWNKELEILMMIYA